MIRRRQTKRARKTVASELDGLYEWVQSLPWVVERPRDSDAPQARTFAVDCRPLGIRRIWLVTGVHGDAQWGSTGLAVVLPLEAATAVAADGEGRGVAFLKGGHVLVSVNGDPPDPMQVERLLLSAYGHAMSTSSATDVTKDVC